MRSWDLFVNFRPVSDSVCGKWSNIFTNYTHTWWGVKLNITEGAGANGSTGSIAINTDTNTWVEDTGLAFKACSEQTRGPATTSVMNQVSLPVAGHSK